MTELASSVHAYNSLCRLLYREKKLDLTERYYDLCYYFNDLFMSCHFFITYAYAYDDSLQS